MHLQLLVTGLHKKDRGALDYLLLQYFQHYRSGAAATPAKLLIFPESMPSMLDRRAAVGTSLKFSLASAQPHPSKGTEESRLADAMWADFNTLLMLLTAADSGDQQDYSMNVEERRKGSVGIAPGQWSIALADSCSVDSSCLATSVHGVYRCCFARGP